MQTLSSYLMGAWCAGDDEGSPLYDPTTEAIVARTSTTGLDIGSAMAYARETGGPALRALMRMFSGPRSCARYSTELSNADLQTPMML